MPNSQPTLQDLFGDPGQQTPLNSPPTDPPEVQRLTLQHLFGDPGQSSPTEQAKAKVIDAPNVGTPESAA